jgi:hypothetical protein
MPRSLIIAVLLCLTCTSLLFAATPQQSGAADPPDASTDLLRALGPSLAPSPSLEPLPAPERLRIVIAAPAPTIGRVALKNGQQVHYPQAAVTASAIVKIATRQVSSAKNRCARTMREALGWGLGDAHQWVSLEKRGWSRRQPGEGAKPGDIMVWPFTFGSRGTQHIGVAVGTDAGTRLLSNLSGSIEISGLAPGYRAYYKRLPVPQPRVVESGCIAHRLPGSDVAPRLAVTTMPVPLPQMASRLATTVPGTRSGPLAHASGAAGNDAVDTKYEHDGVASSQVDKHWAME